MVKKLVKIECIGASSTKSKTPILFDNIIERSGFSVSDIMLQRRPWQARGLSVSEDDDVWPVGRDHACVKYVID